MNKKDTGIITQLYWKLLPSQIFCSMVASLSTIINGLIVGNTLDSNSVAALGLVGLLSTLLGVISNLVSGGARIVCGKYIGRGQFERVNSAFSASVLMLIIFGAVSSFCYISFARQIAILLGATGSVIDTTALYIRANTLGLLALVLSPCLMSFLDMNNQTRYSLSCAVVLAVCSLVFGLINIKVFNGGLFGMGIASSLSQIVCFLCLACKFIFDKQLPRIKIKGLLPEVYKEIVVLGLPSALIVLYNVRNMFLNRFAGQIGGEEALTSLSILMTCSGIFDSIAVGTGSTILMINSVMYGEGDRDSIQRFFSFSVKTSILINSIKGVVFALLSKPLAILFGAKGTILTLTTNLLICYSLTMPLNGMPIAWLNTYAAIGKSKLVNSLYPFSCFIFPMIFVAIFIPLLQINAIWLSFAGAEALVVVTLILISAIKNKHFPRHISDLLFLDDSFGYDAKDSISITVTNVEEVVEVSKKVNDYALERGADKKKAYIIGLCLEEMASNIVLHGFTKRNRKNDNYIDIYVKYYKGKFYTRLRDNAPEFNPQRRLEQDKEDITKNMGIKMVNKLATNMYYQTTFGMNMLTIEI